MKKKIEDERIIQEAHKQNSLAFSMLYFGVLIDLLYRQFILQETITRYWDLALLFFGVTFYLAAKRVNSGILTSKSNLKVMLPSAIVAAVTFLLVSYWYLGNNNPIELIIGGTAFFVGVCAINLLMQYISSKKNNEILEDE